MLPWGYGAQVGEIFVQIEEN
eukprot:COSAG01_NODE_68620_length_263_cov_1.262195_2_plen_20_part_01